MLARGTTTMCLRCGDARLIPPHRRRLLVVRTSFRLCPCWSDVAAISTPVTAERQCCQRDCGAP